MPGPNGAQLTGNPPDGKTPPYPEGMPLRPDEIQSASGRRPRCTEGGESLCWEFPTRAGCQNPEETCARGKHEVIKLRGLRTLIRMHLARRGGRKSEKKIPPADVDGYIKGLILSLAEQDAKYVPKPPPEGKYVRKSPRPNGKEKAKAIGADRLESNATPAVSQGILGGGEESTQSISSF